MVERDREGIREKKRERGRAGGWARERGKKGSERKTNRETGGERERAGGKEN